MSALTFPTVEKKLMVNFFAGTGIFFSLLASSAQTSRDPTLPPVVQQSAKTTLMGPSLSINKSSLAIVVREGRSYVVLESNLYAQGQSYGGVRVERIGETEVWFREHNVLYKIPRFPGVQRSTPVSGVKPSSVLPVEKLIVP